MIAVTTLSVPGQIQTLDPAMYSPENGDAHQFSTLCARRHDNPRRSRDHGRETRATDRLVSQPGGERQTTAGKP
jgi:hypothetical protein